MRNICCFCMYIYTKSILDDEKIYKCGDPENEDFVTKRNRSLQRTYIPPQASVMLFEGAVFTAHLLIPKR